jgi:hypothetical protein
LYRGTNIALKWPKRKNVLHENLVSRHCATKTITIARLKA